MRVLCLSTYELGQQPVGLGAEVALLEAAGHEVSAADLSVEVFPAEAAAAAEAVVFSVTMHTATELSLQAARRITDQSGKRPFAFLGLYAPVLDGHELVGDQDLLAAGETGEALLGWLEALEAGASRARSGVEVSIGRPRPLSGPLPARRRLPPLERYARYLEKDRAILVAGVETTRGCNHSCRHCPVAAIYGGRSRAVELEAVLADVDQAVSLGAGHISFLDPDFLNRPRHAMAVAAGLAARHPGLSFDATIKIEHLNRHRELLEPLAGYGLSFVTSAFESTDDRVLALLDKGHTAAGARQAVAACRRAGIEIRPSWLPFNPWTTLSSLASLLDFAARADLVASTDAVQYSIRLLLPTGSLLLREPDPVLEAALGPESTGNSSWRHSEPAIDALQAEVAALVAREPAGSDPVGSFEAIWRLMAKAGAPLPREIPQPEGELASHLAAGERPRLTEAWFCCAEPTAAQLEAVSG